MNVATLLEMQHPVSADEAVAAIPRDATIVCGGLPAAPQNLLCAICRRLPELGSPTLYCGDLTGRFSFLDEVPESCRGRLRLLVGGGPIPVNDRARVDLLPFSVFDTERMIAGGQWKVDVCLAAARPSDRAGRWCLSPQVGCLRTAIDHAALVLLEVDESLPLLYGDTDLAFADVDAWIESSGIAASPLQERHTAVHERIARHVAGLVPDGACIQIGIGGLAEAILSALTSHRDLSLHSGFVGDGAVRLMAAGVLNGARHPFAPGKAVAGALLGSRSLYEFADRNPTLEMRSFAFVNNPATVASIPAFFAINSALAVDLYGQVGAEGVGGAIKAGGGGQMDFMPGAHLSPGGAAVIALPSTAAGAMVSRIVPPAQLAGPVTCHRNWIDFVITEYGVADVRGVGLLERARRIIEVAHPDHRDALAASIAGIFAPSKSTT